MSLRASDLPAGACSGDMYAGVPATAPGRLEPSCRRPASGVVFAEALAGLRQLRQAEVEHLDDAVRRHHDVAGLEVAVDDAARVRGGERVGERDRDAQRLAEAAARWRRG